MKKNSYDGWELHDFDKAFNFRQYQYSFFKRYLKGNIAEIGPGNGYFVSKYLENKSNKIHLFEPSLNLYKNLKKRVKKSKKIKIYNNKLKLKKDYYDCIIYLDVIEHIKNDVMEIRKAYSSLKKNGHIIICVPAFQFLYSNFDKDVGHIKRYRKKDFQVLQEKIKFNLIKLRYFDSIGFFLSFISKTFLNKNYKNNFNKKIKLWNNLIFFSKILDFLTNYNFGKSLLVILKR